MTPITATSNFSKVLWLFLVATSASPRGKDKIDRDRIVVLDRI